MIENFGTLSKLGPKSYIGPLKVPHLGELGEKFGYDVEKMVYRRLFQYLPADDYIAFMREFPVHALDTSNDYYFWRLGGTNQKVVTLLDWTDLAGAKPSKVGQNSAQWYMYFAEPLFKIGDIVLGETPLDYNIIVKDFTEVSKDKYEYRVELINQGSLLMSVPDSELAVGSNWSKGWQLSPNERSYQGTDFYMNTFVELKAPTSLHRMQYKVDGNMIEQNKPMPFGMVFKDDAGAKISVGAYVNYFDALAIHQFEMQAARAFILSQKNYDNSDMVYNIDDKNKCVIKSFPGFFKQIAATNTIPQNSINLDQIVDIAQDLNLAYKYDEQLYLVIETGYYGYQEASKWLENRSTTYTPNWTLHRIQENGDMGGQGLTYQGVFTRFRSYNGVNIEIRFRKFFDDPELWKQKDPSGLGLVSSRHMLIRSGVKADGQFLGDSGIKRLSVKAYEDGIFRYIPGMRNPFSPGGTGWAGKSSTVSPEDAYEVHGMMYNGCVIEDPTKILFLPRNVA
jgi:hypothetical protein